ncbi:hypothetical protein OROGR_022313 [Orobanche gracilis]
MLGSRKWNMGKSIGRSFLCSTSLGPSHRYLSTILDFSSFDVNQNSLVKAANGRSMAFQVELTPTSSLPPKFYSTMSAGTSHFPDDTRAINSILLNKEDLGNKCKMEVESKGGSDSDLSMVISNATKPCKLEKYKRQFQKVTKGDVIDLCEFLFTKDRDYLIRYNDKTPVKAEHLAGKVILLYFVSLSLHPIARHAQSSDTLLLLDIYQYLQHNNDFEIVLIAIYDIDERDSEKRFEEIFSGMPWTAIPFSDVICRNKMQTNFHVNETTTSFVVDASGMVLQRDIGMILENYGFVAYPFSDERVRQYNAEIDEAVRNPSLITLLGSPQRDYLISNKGEKVPIRTLEGKVVALYFYEDGLSHNGFIENIRTVYEDLAEMKQDFEVVLIYVSDSPGTCGYKNEESFWKVFKTMPWLALPYKDPNISKLKHVFEYLPPFWVDVVPPELVIFGPRGEFIEPMGSQILYLFKAPAYPFTREKVAKLETKKVEKLKKEMLWDPNTVFKRTDGSQVKFSQVVGKRVAIFFERDIHLGHEYSFLMMLKERYLELKGTYEEFEMIHIFEREMDDDPIVPIGDLPWLVSRASELLPGGFDFYCCFEDEHIRSTFLAFDRDGKLVRRTIFPMINDREFPFYAGSLEEETLIQLINLFGWDYWEDYQKKGRIFTFHKKLGEPSYKLVNRCRVWNINMQDM